MKDKAYVVWGYAAILFIGGIIGFLKANSYSSLAVSAFFAGFLARYAYGMWQNNIFHYKMALGNLIVLLFFFAYRYFLTHNMMPAGIMSILTLLVLLYLFLKPKT